MLRLIRIILPGSIIRVTREGATIPDNDYAPEHSRLIFNEWRGLYVKPAKTVEAALTDRVRRQARPHAEPGDEPPCGPRPMDQSAPRLDAEASGHASNRWRWSALATRAPARRSCAPRSRKRCLASTPIPPASERSTVSSTSPAISASSGFRTTSSSPVSTTPRSSRR